MLLRHSIRWFRALAQQGRPDLAAYNAAVDGRFRLAVLYNRRSGLAPKQAWKLAWRAYRQERTYEEGEK